MIVDTFAQYYPNMPQWLQDKLIDLGPDAEKCVIMTTKNFKKVAQVMKPQSETSCGMWSFYLWHKDNALSFTKYPGVENNNPKDRVLRVIVGSKFELFAVSYGPRMPKEWCNFADRLVGSNEQFVILTGQMVFSESGSDKLFISGGRLYFEPSDTKIGIICK